uniref:Cytochrome b5 domain-containing protein 1 n=1 Tax=Timema monikensis TaxID=170555 RepID=A0A7R9EAW6_9NEOP|nr:unnamed protein product [Timema monikensis]
MYEKKLQHTQLVLEDYSPHHWHTRQDFEGYSFANVSTGLVLMAVAARRHYTPAEVVVHNSPNDLWVSFLGRVLDLTSLAQEYDGTQEIKPILAHAGKDISHWFDSRTGESWLPVAPFYLSTPPYITEHEEIWQQLTERERSKTKYFSIKTLCKLIFLTQLKHRIHPVTGVRVPYTPHGPIPHVSLEVPNPLWRPVGVPWWLDPKYVIGFLTEKVRPVRILNVLTGQECTLTASTVDTSLITMPGLHRATVLSLPGSPTFLSTPSYLRMRTTVKHHVAGTVCKEDKLSRILERFLPFNSHASSYTFKFETRVLDMNKTLEENDIPDERELFLDLGLEDNFYIPALMIYFNDDLTEM